MYKIQRGWITPRKQDPLNEHEQCSYELTKTRQHAQGVHRTALGPQCIYYGSQFRVFFMIFLSRQWVGLWFCAIYLTLSLCLSFSTAKCSSFYFIPSNPVHFLMRKCKQIVFPLELQKDGCPHDSWVLT